MSLKNKLNPKNVTELDTNKIHGNSAEAKEKAKAMTALEIAKANEVFKLQKGYRFMNLGKVSKLVHPDNIQKHLNDGYKF